MANLSTTDTLRLSCPIIRDAWNRPPFWIGVNVVDANPNAGTGSATNACCQFYSTDSASVNVFWGNAKACTLGSQTPNALQINPQSVGSFTNGTEMLFCEIPPVVNGQISQLVSYAVSE